MRYPASNFKGTGFTLAELLIALAILGVIATFTIPKVLQASNSAQNNSIAKETVAATVGALEMLRYKEGITSATTMNDVVRYLNYVKTDTSLINNREAGASASLDCGAAGNTCYRLHSGAVIYFPSAGCFRSTDSSAALVYQIDPDGQLNDIKGLRVFLYYNGHIRTDDTVDIGTTYSVTCGGTSTVAATFPPDPPWFSWSN